jgi:hypothetical protein
MMLSLALESRAAVDAMNEAAAAHGGQADVNPILGTPVYLSGENEVGVKNELSIFATIGPEASLAVRTRTHSGSVTNVPHFASLSAMLSQTSM